MTLTKLAIREMGKISKRAKTIPCEPITTSYAWPRAMYDLAYVMLQNKEKLRGIIEDFPDPDPEDYYVEPTIIEEQKDEVEPTGEPIVPDEEPADEDMEPSAEQEPMHKPQKKKHKKTKPSPAKGQISTRSKTIKKQTPIEYLTRLYKQNPLPIRELCR